MDRTMRLLLKPSHAQGDLLAETARQFTAVFNAVCAYGWEHREKNGVRLHHALYRSLKADSPALVSDHHIQARVKAREAVKSALTRQKQGRRVSAPRSVSCPPRYNRHTFKVDWERGEVNLATVGGRQRIPFAVPAHAVKYAGGTVATADLIYRDGRWFLHVVVDVVAPDIAPTDAVIGVDLGLAQPAVTSEAAFLGKKAWRAVEHRRFKLRRALQAKGTRSAKRHLRKLKGKQRRFRRDCDHVLSKQIVQSNPPGSTIVVENLANIRSRVKTRKGKLARRIHGWSFDQCRRFIAYKAEERGCTVAGVDPRHTSQQCSRCGHTARANRRSRALFVCRACGFSLHADLNGARNVAARYRVGRGAAASGGPPVNRPIVGEDRHLGDPSAHKLPDLSGGR
jgi:putative transposase